MKQVNEMKNNILHQVLDQEARARCLYIYVFIYFRISYILTESAFVCVGISR